MVYLSHKVKQRRGHQLGTDFQRGIIGLLIGEHLCDRFIGVRPHDIFVLLLSLIHIYNEMIKEVNTQITTRPDKSYGPLTEEQKEEMSEKSIENWEKKAKEGLLYNDSTMRALSMDLQSCLLYTSTQRDGGWELCYRQRGV